MMLPRFSSILNRNYLRIYHEAQVVGRLNRKKCFPVENDKFRDYSYIDF